MQKIVADIFLSQALENRFSHAASNEARRESVSPQFVKDTNNVDTLTTRNRIAFARTMHTIDSESLDYIGFIDRSVWCNG